MVFMTIKGINIENSIESVRELLSQEKEISPALKAAIEVIILALTLVCEKLGLNSSNSSIPPSQDSNRKKEKSKKKSGKRVGGQNGHTGKTLQKVEDPDEILEHKVKKCFACNHNISSQEADGHETRQVFDIVISRVVTEHRSQIKTCKKCGTVNTASFPQEVSKAVQYGSGVKSLSTYMSQYQLIPYKRVVDFFVDQIGLPISAGTIYNFNKEAYEKLQDFEESTQEKLIGSKVNHGDETGININKKKCWLHCISNQRYTYFYPHSKRGKEAMDAMGVLPKYKGILCHDYWKSYLSYSCLHSLCNAHHIRELKFSHEEENKIWAKKMKSLLICMNKAVIEANGKLSQQHINRYIRKYRCILKEGEEECPVPEKVPGKRGRVKKSKSRNLLERLKNHEEDVLRFLKDSDVPFTNNQAERDIRMTKVQQKISGCFRSMEGAQIFCRIRSYLSTARKNSYSAMVALNRLFQNDVIEFR